MANKLKQIVLILLVVLTASCSKKVAGLKSFPEETKEGYIKATVVNLTLDGCSWMLQLEDGKKLEPVNLKEEFKKDKLNVWIQYQVKKGGMSVCMAGEVITISDIKLR